MSIYGVCSPKYLTFSGFFNDFDIYTCQENLKFFWLFNDFDILHARFRFSGFLTILIFCMPGLRFSGFFNNFDILHARKT